MDSSADALTHIAIALASGAIGALFGVLVACVVAASHSELPHDNDDTEVDRD